MIQTEPHHLRMGTRLNNRYLIQGVLGEGSFGITYVGMDEVLCQKVAVKEFFPRGAITRNNQQTNEVVSVYGTKAANFHQGEEKFLQEARTLAQFNNVARSCAGAGFLPGKWNGIYCNGVFGGNYFKAVFADVWTD